MLATQLHKYALLSGIMMIFLGGLQGIAIDNMPNKPMGKSAHHQMMHNGQVMMILSFAFAYCKLSNNLLTATFWLLQFGGWCNPLAHIVIAMTNCPQPLFANSPTLVAPGSGDNNFYTKLTTFMLLGPTVCGMTFGLLLLMYGLIRSDFGRKSA